MTNALVPQKICLPKSQRARRAAQYVRMSTDYQQYSIANQFAVIAAYAQKFDLEIVSTYRDDGKSGLQIKGRTGLQDLIDDVQSARADFSCILVFDVSRWGRFQDVDESAYYEFICKRAGVRVIYCAELFGNDGGLMASLAKNVKRAMAAEWSRERSEKVHAGACFLSRLGFRQGGRPCLGLRRELIDISGRSRGVLQKGERKYLQTDRVILRHGPAEEVELVRSIFRQFALKKMKEVQIARWLNSIKVGCPTGRPWTAWIVHNMLTNENYIGNIVYNRHPFRLRERRWFNPPDRWVRKAGAFEPVVEPRLFARAQDIIATRKKFRERSNEELLKQLRIALHKNGRLTRAIIEKTPGMSRPSVYQLRFGTLRNAFSLIGYTPERDCEYIDTRQDRCALLQEISLRLATALAEFGEDVRLDQFTSKIEVRGIAIVFRTARTSDDGNERHSSIWTVKREQQTTSGLAIIARLDASNKAPRDFFVVPVSTISQRLRFSENSLSRYGLRPIEAVDGVIRAVKRRLQKSDTVRI
ncbi:recombinase family protein [Bradyrhizobium sp. CB1717]|uniref:recombinase family protein n=1 Tax=Bradyrhizobium sp. CB1717 TaxID=3039154 RepID=UPI0024B27185|nr:recombinase family protein [Bradyrhizobium sp. CB1717]WFU21151.1 recombinase family protein [Bradyrhizobium sp. CB1717]